ncbi:DNA polymerase III subunit beta [Cyclobacterium marinum]|uniref:Beta sliding clamp n=1 Tax=Cyclobacterium marinum (strain ATCC 25205 / DSM 745 / LMG 13164 / NCIMB 1802) TaxID=880070 RepID=G0IZF4_CYCMS|nr:DNA polymerase III subunit beta [Cyclobacterium marinum]AEL24427.1 DNA polymerase III, beta subunit [Cyclobacterium marinum DSM 745]MBI0399085.1 DNA polymerase III subunit beta [Cyclobacterium marinum]MBR9773477.1 DNA polymerase III subunit beta [Cytophagales bacterium]|tara:strand:+ start:14362 stop:15486 length:1125 start_codon:yes stop_codon:yes gene_type:complete
MKFIVSSSSLLKHLSAINGVVTTNPVVPILENFLFEILDSKLTVTASDLQTSMTTEIEVEAKEDGNIAVPAKILIETLKNLPEQPVTFSIDKETYSVEISSDNGRYKLAGENATDFPRIPSVTNASTVEMSTDVLSSAIANTIFATSNDELRPAMTGVFINLSSTNTTFVATDGHRLIRYRRVDIASPEASSIIVPRKALNLLKSTLPAENVPVTVEFNSSNAYFKFNNIKMICRLIDERFPDYENVIPADNNNDMVINRQEFLGSLKRIAIYANKTTHQVRLKLTGSELQISAEDLDFSNEANERLSCEHEGEDIEIGFNAKFLVEMLNNISAKEVTLKFSAPNRAGLILPSDLNENEDILMLVMPVMLSNYV